MDDVLAGLADGDQRRCSLGPEVGANDGAIDEGANIIICECLV